MIAPDALQNLQIDRAGEAGLQAVDPAPVVDPGPLSLGDGGDARAGPVQGLLGIACELLRAILHAQQLAEQPVHLRRLVQGAIEENVGDLGLILHSVGEGDVRWADAADVDDQVGLELQHVLQIGHASAPREAAVLRQIAHALAERRPSRPGSACAPSRPSSPAQGCRGGRAAGGPAATTRDIWWGISMRRPAESAMMRAGSCADAEHHSADEH